MEFEWGKGHLDDLFVGDAPPIENAQRPLTATLKLAVNAQRLRAHETTFFAND